MSESDRHPFLSGLSKHRGAQPTCVVIFGASGDLAARKLLPALYNLAVDSLLPADFHLVGFGRKPVPDAEFRAQSAKDIARFSRREFRPDIWKRVEDHSSYVAGGYDDPAAYEALKRRIADAEKAAGRPLQLVFYVSTPPTVFEAILENLGRSGLAARNLGSPLESKVIIEKPFGRDLASAVTLNSVAARNFREPQVFRIDHYLGKETVQDLLVQRFANPMFEPLWNRQHVDHVQITVAEELGVGSRGGYYDHSGATRDMLQNHTMQLLALTAMEQPRSLSAEHIRDEKVKLLESVRALRLGPGGDAVRAQYSEGLAGGEKVPGYLTEKDIPSDSPTETFCALRLSVENSRWAGVPFYMRSGKRLARRVSEIAVQFKQPESGLFAGDARYDLVPNRLFIQIQPDEGTTLVLNSKVPGLEPRTQPVRLSFRYATTYGSNTPEAYERLILDAIVGDRTLFIRGDETEASWRLFTPLLESWSEAGRKGLESYAAGSWGPAGADALLGSHGHAWRNAGR
ncbi:MAG: glucose-6-phosphate dehydrogenase [Opitutia bacterium]